MTEGMEHSTCLLLDVDLTCKRVKELGDRNSIFSLGFLAWQSLAYCGKLNMTLWYWIFTFEDLITVMRVTINTLE